MPGGDTGGASRGRVCVAGATGLVGSNIVREALSRGYAVHGTLRDAGDERRTRPLMKLPGAEERLTLFSADMSDGTSFDEAMAGADCVFIACLTPILEGFDGTPAAELDDERGWNEIIESIRSGCLEIMRSAARAGVRDVIVCSSTSSANPPAPVEVKNEVDHRSDAAAQCAQNKYVSAEKIVMEDAARAFADEHGQRVCFLLPTLMVGPVVLPEHLEGGFLKSLRDMVRGRPGQHDQITEGSISMVHIHDVARLFLAAYETSGAHGRYFAVYDSWPWRDVYRVLAELVPESAMPEPLDGEPEPPTRFDFSRRDSLGVMLRDIPTTLRQTVAWLDGEPFDRLCQTNVAGGAGGC